MSADDGKPHNEREGNGMKNLTENKKNALQAYKEAKATYLATITRDNIKGDFEKFKAFTDAKRNCMKLGVII